MKKVIFSFLVLVCASALFAFDVSDLKIKGQAKSVTKTNYLIVQKFGDYYRTPVTKTVYTYNGAQQMTGSTEYSGAGTLQNKVTSNYDGQGFLTSETCSDSNNATLWSTTISYREGRKVDATESSKNGTLRAKTVYEYTADKLTSETYYNGDGSIAWKEITTYNTQNLIDSISTYYANGALDERKVYSYTPSSLIDTVTHLNENGDTTKKDVYHYDEKALLSEITTYGADGKAAVRLILKYDGRDNVIKITTYNVVKKFGSIINEMVDMSEFAYEY